MPAKYFKPKDGSWLGAKKQPPGTYKFKLILALGKHGGASFKADFVLDNELAKATLNGQQLDFAVGKTGLGQFPVNGASLAAGSELFKQGDNVLELDVLNTGEVNSAIGMYFSGV